MSDSQFQAYMVCYLWDLVDEGIDEVLDRLQGEAGVDGVVVPVYTLPEAHFRCHPDVSPRTFHTEGGCHFQPEASAYGATRLKPIVAPWLRKRDPLGKVAEACTKRGLKLRLRINGAMWLNPRMPKAYEACTTKDAFGESGRRDLCPSNPDVQVLLQSLATDLSERFPASYLELNCPCFEADPTAYVPNLPTQFVGIGDWLMTLCFCESCQQAAHRDGVDVESAARSVRAYLEEFFKTGQVSFAPKRLMPDGRIFHGFPSDEFFEQDPIIKAYADWRCTQVTRALAGIRRASRIALMMEASVRPYENGADPAQLAEHVDMLSLWDRETDDEDRAMWDKPAAAFCTYHEPFIDNRAGHGDAANLVRFAAQAVQKGIRMITLQDYGSIPWPQLDRTHQAVRYARRELM